MCEKMAMFCDVDPEAVIQNLTAASIYQVPMLMEEQGIDVYKRQVLHSCRLIL